MCQGYPVSQQPTAGSIPFRFLQENWADLGRIERLGIAGLIVLIAQKNRSERAIKNFLVSLLRSH